MEGEFDTNSTAVLGLGGAEIDEMYPPPYFYPPHRGVSPPLPPLHLPRTPPPLYEDGDDDIEVEEVEGEGYNDGREVYIVEREEEEDDENIGVERVERVERNIENVHTGYTEYKHQLTQLANMKPRYTPTWFNKVALEAYGLLLSIAARTVSGKSGFARRYKTTLNRKRGGRGGGREIRFLKSLDIDKRTAEAALGIKRVKEDVFSNTIKSFYTSCVYGGGNSSDGGGNSSDGGKMDRMLVKTVTGNSAKIVIDTIRNNSPNLRIAVFLPSSIEIVEAALKHNPNAISIIADEQSGWEYPFQELNKLRDADVIVISNPAVPTGEVLSTRTIGRIRRLIQQRKTRGLDTIIVVDNSYALFSDPISHPLFRSFPGNTIITFSFAPFYGARGWNSSLIMLPLGSVSSDIVSTTTSTQDVVMMLLASHSVYTKSYARKVAKTIQRRKVNLFTPLDRKQLCPHSTTFSAINLIQTANNLSGTCEFGKYISTTTDLNKFLQNLAENYDIVLDGGMWYGASEWVVVVNMAVYSDEMYTAIGNAIRSSIQKKYTDFLMVKRKIIDEE